MKGWTVKSYIAYQKQQSYPLSLVTENKIYYQESQVTQAIYPAENQNEVNPKVPH